MSLPSGYKRLEYIQSSGTQYIDTGIAPSRTLNVVTTFTVNDDGWNNYSIFGSAWSESGFMVDALSGGKVVFYSKGYGKQVSANVGSPNTIECSQSEFVVNGTSYQMTGTGAESTNNIFIFWVGNQAYTDNRGRMKLYSFQMYDNGTIVRDFIPCKKPDGTIGLWDDVNSVFYGNAGTGAFTAGTVIAIAADASEITKLEYIQSNGTQYIDTGIVPKNNTRVDADCDITYGTNWIMILGSYDPNKYFSWWANGATIYAYYGTSNKIVAGENGRQTLSANKNIWTAGNSTISFSEASFTANTSIYLFSVHNGGDYSKASMKLYSCQIYDNDVLVRDFIAAKLSDGTVGLYDKLSGLLYINAGTGTFEAGPAVNLGGIFVKVNGVWKQIDNITVNVN